MAVAPRWLLSLWLFAFAFLARSDVILDWNALMLDSIRADNTAPTAATRNLAMLHVAVWDAVNSITRTHQPYRFSDPAPPGTSKDAAAVAAGYEIVTALYPSLAAWADELYEDWLATVEPGEALENGLALGADTGRRVLDSRRNDGATTDVPYIPGNVPGEWQRTPPFFRPPLAPQWGYVDPFCLEDIEPFVPGPPPPLDSPEYAASFNEVKAIGGQNSSVRTAEESQIAVFWSDFSYTATPPGHWQEIAASIAQDRNNTLEENARLFALLSLAQADAAIVCWEAKYGYNLWRPVTAIQRAHEDENPATEPDADWSQFLVAPPFPSYTSGHSTFSKASAQVLAHFFGTDAIAFTVGSDSLPGVFRTFESFAECADEIGRSRVYGGIHFEFDNREGKTSGAKIADYVAANFLLPNDRLPVLRLERLVNGLPQLRMHGHIGAALVLEASTDLKQWQPISTNTATAGGVTVTDANAASFTARFYRVLEPAAGE